MKNFLKFFKKRTWQRKIYPL